MEMPVESDLASQETAPSILELRLLGPLAVRCHGAELALPASRKVRALLAYLSLSPRGASRSQLCELLWDVPNDPRGELRWCLSKIRRVVDEPGRQRVETRADTVRLDFGDCLVDAIEIARATQEGIKTVGLDRLGRLAAMFGGEFLEGLDIDRSPSFNAWLIAQRRRFRGYHIAVLEQLAQIAPEDEAFPYLEKWLELAPFDRRVHELLLQGFAQRGQLRDGEEHAAAAVAQFEAEGLDGTPIRSAWRSARKQRQISLEPATPVASRAIVGGEDNLVAVGHRRASIAVMPFVDGSAVTFDGGGTADALAHDVITRLAKLRSLFVIAQGTVFSLHERQVGPEAAGRVLNVDYVVSGAVRRARNRLNVTVELAETRSARIIWAEIFDHTRDDAFLVLDEIGNRIVASIANEIEATERNRAILRPPNSLDAWEAHHRGLWHMYRFNQADNDRAQNCFEMALRLDPTFARAYAGLSFTHFQNAFQGWADRQSEIERAFQAAGQSLMVDDRDPAAHWAMGRAHWLRGRFGESIAELEQATELSPNFAQAHYTLAFVHSQAGDPDIAISSSDHSRNLSPFDPLLFGMLGARAMALVRLRRFEEAAEWGVRAAARPNAHAQIRAIAAFSLALAGRVDEARSYLASIHKTLPRYGVDDFLTAMKFPPDGERLFRQAARQLGI